MAEIPNSPELAGRQVIIGIDEHLSYFKDPLFAEKTEQLRFIFKEMQSIGIKKHRYDIKWEDVQSRPDETDLQHLERLRKIGEMAKEAGMDNGIVLSHPPKWALELAKKDPQEFIAAFTEFVDVALDALAGDGKNSVVPSSIQIFNELNVPIYTIKEVYSLLPDCVDIVKNKSFEKFGKKIPLMTTLNVTNPLLKGTNFPWGDPVEFIQQNRDILSNFDEIGLDYYPGIWHMPPETVKLYWENRNYFLDVFKFRNDPDKIKALTKQPHIDMFRRVFGNMELLERTIKELKPLGKRVLISEVGAPTVIALDSSKMRKEHEKWQEMAIRAMSLGLSRVMAANGIDEVDFYCLTNKPGTKPPPDSEGPVEWGWLRDTGLKKEALTSRSLQRIVALFHHPIQRSTFDNVHQIWVGSGSAPLESLTKDATQTDPSEVS